MKSSKNRFLESHIIKVGNISYIFTNVELEQSPSGKWGLSYRINQELMKAICADILANPDRILTFSELEFLANTAERSFAKIAEVVKINRSTISKWKSSGERDIPYHMGFTIKCKMAKIIFSDIEIGEDDAGQRMEFWIKKAKLRPFAKVA